MGEPWPLSFLCNVTIDLDLCREGRERERCGYLSNRSRRRTTTGRRAAPRNLSPQFPPRRRQKSRRLFFFSFLCLSDLTGSIWLSCKNKQINMNMLVKIVCISRHSVRTAALLLRAVCIPTSSSELGREPYLKFALRIRGNWKFLSKKILFG